jgi:hypothetical protein
MQFNLKGDPRSVALVKAAYASLPPSPAVPHLNERIR